jgi:hypothetical protein
MPARWYTVQYRMGRHCTMRKLVRILYRISTPCKIHGVVYAYDVSYREGCVYTPVQDSDQRTQRATLFIQSTCTTC